MVNIWGQTMKKDLSHFDQRGQAIMVDVSKKSETHRVASAAGAIRMLPATLRRVYGGKAAKGDVLGVARIAAIQGAKRTSELIPLCHPLQMSKVFINFKRDTANSRITLFVTVSAIGRTGVEMEALTAVSIGLLTVYDMCKAIDRGMTIESIFRTEKSGGQSGHYINPMATSS